MPPKKTVFLTAKTTAMWVLQRYNTGEYNRNVRSVKMQEIVNSDSRRTMVLNLVHLFERCAYYQYIKLNIDILHTVHIVTRRRYSS